MGDRQQRWPWTLARHCYHRGPERERSWECRNQARDRVLTTLLRQPLPVDLANLSLQTSDAGRFGWPLCFGIETDGTCGCAGRRGTGMENEEDQEGRAEGPCMY